MKYLLLLAALAAPAIAAAAGPVPLGPNAGKFGDWTAAAYGSGANKACYAFTIAQSSAPALPGRGAVMLTVTERKTAKDEVTLSAGYIYPAKASVSLTVGTSTIGFYTKGSTAFTSSGTAAVTAFQSGAIAIAKSTGPAGARITDNFSLTGFSSAYSAITACP